MKKGFYTIMSAQFFSSLADNALLVAAIELLRTSGAPSWHVPALTPMFALFYVILAPLVGAFADAVPKGTVMLISNTIKVIGCLLMLFGANPLLSYGIVGLGAAAYSPAKYGILTELLPNSQLVKANGWIEGLTILSIIFGVLLGGQLLGHVVSQHLLAFDVPMFDTGISTAPEAAVAVIVVLYVIAALFNLRIPRTEAPLAADRAQHRRAGARLLELQRAPVERQAGPDLAGDDDAVLGRLRQPARDRLRLGGGGARVLDHPSLESGWRARHWHRHRRGGRLDAHAARPGDARRPARHRHGRARHLPNLHHATSGSPHRS